MAENAGINTISMKIYSLGFERDIVLIHKLKKLAFESFHMEAFPLQRKAFNFVLVEYIRLTKG